jgi:hypothetical protein
MDTAMNQFRLYRRSNGMVYIENKQTRKRESLKTSDPAAAEQMLNAVAPAPCSDQKTWPKIKHPKKCAISFSEYQKIVAREKNPERKLFYELLWHLGGS